MGKDYWEGGMDLNPTCGCAICEIRTQPICINQAIEAVRDVSHGAIDTFLGVVRNHHQGKTVTGITLIIHCCVHSIQK